MRIKKYLVVIVAMLALLTFGLAGCKPDEPAPVDPEQPEPPVAAVTLSQNTAELDVYETLTLTATKENTEEDIVWSTSDGGRGFCRGRSCYRDKSRYRHDYGRCRIGVRNLHGKRI